MDVTVLSVIHGVLCYFLQAALCSELIGNDLLRAGSESWISTPSTAYLMWNNGPNIPYDGYITSFHARVASSQNTSVSFQIWAFVSDYELKLIGQEEFLLTDTPSPQVMTFNLLNPIKVMGGNIIGFWTGHDSSVIMRYPVEIFIEDAILYSQIDQPTEATSYSFQSSNSTFKFALGVTVESEFQNETIRFTETEESTTFSEIITTEVKQSSYDLVYGDPSFSGEEWLGVSIFKNVSIILDFNTPIVDGFLNRIQIFSTKRAVELSFQIWRRAASSDSSGITFLLVAESPYTTINDNGFENTSMINLPTTAGDYIGVAVTDGTEGLPIGWSVSGNNPSIYFKSDVTHQPGAFYGGYDRLSIQNNLAITAFVSNEMKDNNENETEVFTTTAAMSTESKVTTSLEEELVIGNKGIVDDPDNLRSFRPFFQVTIALTKLVMPRSGEVYEIGFYATTKGDVTIGIYRPISCEDLTFRCYTPIFLKDFSVNASGPVVFTMNASLLVEKGDILGFYNRDSTSFVIGRLPTSRASDSPYHRIGATVLNESYEFSRYIGGYKYAVFAVLAKVVPTTTTVSTKTFPSETTTDDLLTLTYPDATLKPSSATYFTDKHQSNYNTTSQQSLTTIPLTTTPLTITDGASVSSLSTTSNSLHLMTTVDENLSSDLPTDSNIASLSTASYTDSKTPVLDSTTKSGDSTRTELTYNFTDLITPELTVSSNQLSTQRITTPVLITQKTNDSNEFDVMTSTQTHSTSGEIEAAGTSYNYSVQYLTRNDTTPSINAYTTTQLYYVKGEKGSPGVSGPPGPTGQNGPKGPQGPTGPTGSTGVKGEKGDMGDQGLPGATGATGQTGVTGATGGQGATGITGQSGSTGLKGDPGVVGEAGATGEPGSTGAKGDKGEPGQTGDAGPKGVPGDKGSPGIPGESGLQGIKGAQGEMGVTGPQGQITLQDECKKPTVCPNMSTCTDTELSYDCKCVSGYVLNGEECIDANECLINNGMCQQQCNNVIGSRTCSCYDGYVLAANGRTCIDIDECSLGLGNCTGGQRCFNEVGSFKCLVRLTSRAERLRQIESLGAEDWWPLVVLILFVWAAVLTIVLIVIVGVLCFDARKSERREFNYYESAYSSSN